MCALRPPAARLHPRHLPPAPRGLRRQEPNPATQVEQAPGAAEQAQSRPGGGALPLFLGLVVVRDSVFVRDPARHRIDLQVATGRATDEVAPRPAELVGRRREVPRLTRYVQARLHRRRAARRAGRHGEADTAGRAASGARRASRKRKPTSSRSAPAVIRTSIGTSTVDLPARRGAWLITTSSTRQPRTLAPTRIMIDGDTRFEGM